MQVLNFDYNQNGYYFITICTKDMQCLLSSVVGADDLGSPHVELKNYGKIVEKNINLMNDIYKNMNVENYVIMPNHIHLLIHIFNSFQGSPRSSTPTNLISKFVSAFKKFTNEEDLYNHIQYINENPKKWIMGKDEYYV